ERVPYTDDGLEAIIFTAQGDMRQALNNLQSTFSGFGFINSENVFKVCDEPHPLLVKEMIQHCVNANIDEAYKVGRLPPVLAEEPLTSWAEERGSPSDSCSLVASGLLTRRYHWQHLSSV
ncbi:RFC2 isoform 13, partial [Pongo abelii]